MSFELAEIPYEISFGSHALSSSDLLLIEDAARDQRLASNPLVVSKPQVRFYAGMPLVTPDSFIIGTLAVIDFSARSLSAEQAEGLKVLSRQVITHLELRRHLVDLAHSVE